ncbi:MAG: diguanylate cyclase [Defluviitaleaceae bacterium]|nr:diguanylate cyclase [Defluviitaleaceae bacterium]
MSNENRSIDPLTNLYAYERFERDFGHLMAKADRIEGELALCLLDIDNFLRINEEYGHDAGDEVLRRIAAHLKRNMKNIDEDAAYLYRYSGDAFAALLPGIEKERALFIMEKLRETLEVGEITDKNGRLALVKATVSVGIAAYRDDGCNLVELVRKADGALYRAKISGRNKVSLAREEKMITKTSHYTVEQLKRLTELSQKQSVGEAVLLREALDDLMKKYDVRINRPLEERVG